MAESSFSIYEEFSKLLKFRTSELQTAELQTAEVQTAEVQTAVVEHELFHK